MDIKKVASKRVILLGLAVLVVATASAVVRRASSESAKPNTMSLSEAGAPPQGPPDSRKQLVRVFVHGTDIYPSIVRARPGLILLRAENETQSDVTLVVERVRPGQTPAPLTRIKTIDRGKRAHEELALGVGEYVFYEESQPDIKGTLIIEPRAR